MLENPKFCPIIRQSGTYTSNTAQVIEEYLKLFAVVMNKSLGIHLQNYCNSKNHYYQTSNIYNIKRRILVCQSNSTTNY